MSPVDFPVLIVGAGPVGLTLAAGLAKQGIRSIVLEKKTKLDEHSRALVVVARTLEVLQSYGIADRFMEEGNFLRQLKLHDVDRDKLTIKVSFDEIAGETAYAGMLLIPQDRLEHILLDEVLATGLCEVRFDHQFVWYEDASDHIVVSFVDDHQLQTATTVSFLVGCDGAHSTVRRLLKQDLQGITFPVRLFLCDIQIADPLRDQLPFPRLHLTHSGLAGAVRYKPLHWRLLGSIPADESAEQAVSKERISNLVARFLGPGPFEQIWAGVFSIHRRMVPSFRTGRVVLAGDAAHISSPAGGQGMNSGMQDAHNLAWKLAVALSGGSVDQMLKSYDQERRSAIASVVLPFTTYLTRIALRPSLIRIALSAARFALRSRRVRVAAGRSLAMVGARYNGSPLISGEGKWVGRRVPCAPFPGSALISFGASSQVLRNLEQATSKLNREYTLPAFAIRNIQKTDPLWRQWRARRNLVVFVRPDAYVGWAALAPTVSETFSGIGRALGYLG